ncbi:hypothetical protein [Niveibacterium terrae]|uniref:hypothetical protein n=1 Tax=Niveibacterium terrae TaxID=3373598 RepID=UPI003A948985
MSPCDVPVHNSLRQHIAALAARLISEEGITDYGLAKRKAARQLGVTRGEVMPSGAEIEDALRDYQALIHDDEDDERLAMMRETALELMRLFPAWRPALTGAALDGTANGFSEVEIDLFADSAKEVEIALLNRGIVYEHREIRRPGPDAPEAILVFDWDEVPVKLCVYGPFADRMPRRNGGERVRISAVEAMCAARNSQK